MTRRKRNIAEPSTASRKAAIMAASGVKRVKPKAPEPEPVIGKGRQGRKGVVVYLHPVAKQALQTIARDHKTTIQALGVEAINLLFASYGEKPIA